MKAISTIVVGAIVFAALIAYGALVGGLVMMKFWYWFLLPVFTTLPHITFIQAISLSFFLIILKTTFTTKKYKMNGVEIKEVSDGESAAIQLLYPWLVLLLGWLVHLCL